MTKRVKGVILVSVAGLIWLCLAEGSGLTQRLAPNKGVRARADLTRLPSEAKRWALVIGIDQYGPQISPLIGATNDAKRLGEALVKYAGFPKEQVLVVTSDQESEVQRPTRSNILTKLANLKGQIPEDGLFLFAFSGHGIEGRQEKEGYLLPSDIVSANQSVKLLKETAISIRYVREEIESYGVKQVIVLLDACRNDPQADKAGGDNLMGESLASGFNFDRRNTGIEGYVTIYATESGRRAYEDPVKRQGYFSLAFIEGLSGGAANERGEVTLDGLIEYLGKKVPADLRRDQGENAKQVPRAVVDGYAAKGLVLSVTAPKVVVTTPARDPEEVAWEIASSRVDPVLLRSDLQSFLVEFPKGKFAPAARLRLRQLENEVVVRPPEKKASPTYSRTPFKSGTINPKGKLSEIKGECQVYTEDLGNGVTLEMVRIPAGRFLMGSPANEEGRFKDEGPQREVSVAGYLMGKYEVTQRIWKAVAGYPKVGLELDEDPAKFKGENLPIENVSWDEVREFIARLNKRLGLTEETGYRLPSEAEWEYAARAGTRTPFAFGETIDPGYVNYDGNSPYGRGKKGLYRQRIIEVGTLRLANQFGLYDMHGNVLEWCEDDWHDNYNGAPTDGSAWVDVSRAAFRVFRGGSWLSYAVVCRSANRRRFTPGDRSDNLGFRLSRTLP
jgi:formylglycine-generating enzyme required for sulfatase activity/uncharacterized caspase-like protein